MVWAAGPYCLRPVQDNSRLVENFEFRNESSKSKFSLIFVCSRFDD